MTTRQPPRHMNGSTFTCSLEDMTMVQIVGTDGSEICRFQSATPINGHTAPQTLPCPTCGRIGFCGWSDCKHRPEEWKKETRK